MKKQLRLLSNSPDSLALLNTPATLASPLNPYLSMVAYKNPASSIINFSTYVKNNSHKPYFSFNLKFLFGVFDIIIKNQHTNPKAIFLFYNNFENKITHHRIYEGKAFYRYLNSFVRDTIEDIIKKNYMKNLDSKLMILARKNIINKTNISVIKNVLKFSLVEYKRRDLDLPKVIHIFKDEILTKLSSYPFNIESVNQIVIFLNLILQERKNIKMDKGFLINKRRYSTLRNLDNKKTFNIKPSLSLIPYTEKEVALTPYVDKEVPINPYPNYQLHKYLNEYEIKNFNYN
jgi:hypothetical protein